MGIVGLYDEFVIAIESLSLASYRGHPHDWFKRGSGLVLCLVTWFHLVFDCLYLVGMVLNQILF